MKIFRIFCAAVAAVVALSIFSGCSKITVDKQVTDGSRSSEITIHTFVTSESVTASESTTLPPPEYSAPE